MMVIYGLKNCDSCRKALKLAAEAGVAHRFHDLRTDGLPPGRLQRWLAAAGWEALVNRRSTTWRGLPEAERAAAGPGGAAALLERHPTLIKRPIIEAGDKLIVGLAPSLQAELKALARR
jgi:Spx/MgsR family transcriptional regulator